MKLSEFCLSPCIFIYIVESTGIFPARNRPTSRLQDSPPAPEPALSPSKGGAAHQRRGRLPAIGRRRPPHPLSLAHRQGKLSTEILRNPLPEGQYFTIPAKNFLPVGNGFLNSAARGTRRRYGRGRRTRPWCWGYQMLATELTTAANLAKSCGAEFAIVPVDSG